MAKKMANWSVKRVGTMYRNGKVNMDLAIQRKANLWDKSKKSLLVHSILADMPIPAIYLNVAGDVFEIIDGKQRITTVLSYVDDKFTLATTTPSVGDEEIAGLKFSQLPESLQEKLLNASFDIARYENLTEEEIEDLFYRLNNGASLKTIENNRVLLGTKNMTVVANLSNHPFFREKSSISNKRYTDQETVLQIMMLVNNADTGFSSKEIKMFVQGFRGNDLPEELTSTVKETLDYLDLGFAGKKKFLKKLHLPMVFHLAIKAMEQDVEPEYFALWVEEFFTNLSDDSEYLQACQSGSAKKENVQKRLAYITQAFKENFK